MAGNDDRAALARLMRELGESARQASRDELHVVRTQFASRVLPSPDVLETPRAAGRYVLRKYEKHVVRDLRWPIDTTPAEYLETLRRTILTPHGGVRLYPEPQSQQQMLLFVGPTRS